MLRQAAYPAQGPQEEWLFPGAMEFRLSSSPGDSVSLKEYSKTLKVAIGIYSY